MLSKNINLFSREEFFDKIYRRSGSFESRKVAVTAIRKLDTFCQETFQKNLDDIISEINQNISENPNDMSAMVFLDKFSGFLQSERRAYSTINGYVSFAKKYLRQCGGIRISSEDIQDYVTIPVNTEDEDLEPLTHDELRSLIENTPSSRRKAFYMIMKDTGVRTREGLQIQKKHIDLEKGTIMIPKKNTKGKRRKRIQRITPETIGVLKRVLPRLQDDDCISTANHGNLYLAYKTEYDAFHRVRTKAGLLQKYDSGRFKKNLHSIRAFCYTQCKLATGDADYAHGYLGHDRYLAVYERMEEKEQTEQFNRCIPRLSVFEDVVVVANDELKEKYEKEIAKIRQEFENYKKEVDEKIELQKKAPAKLVIDKRLANIEN